MPSVVAKIAASTTAPPTTGWRNARRRTGAGEARLVCRRVDLFEYQGKQYFARYGIPVSPGGVARTVDEAVVQADAAGYPVVLKAQVQVGGQGKAGGIKLADSADEARTRANILGMDIKAHVVELLWVEHAADIDEEYYASFTLDRAAKQHLLMLSARAGSTSRRSPAPTPTPSSSCTSTRSQGSARRRLGRPPSMPASTGRSTASPP